MNRFLFILLLSSTVSTVFAQHQHHEGMSMPGTNDKAVSKPKADTIKPMDHSMHDGMDMGKQGGMSTAPAVQHGMNMDDSMGGMDGMKMLNHGLTMDTTMGMTHSLSRNLSMNRNGSGTSWHPDQYAHVRVYESADWQQVELYAALRHLSALYKSECQ